MDRELRFKVLNPNINMETWQLSRATYAKDIETRNLRQQPNYPFVTVRNLKGPIFAGCFFRLHVHGGHCSKIFCMVSQKVFHNSRPVLPEKAPLHLLIMPAPRRGPSTAGFRGGNMSRMGFSETRGNLEAPRFLEAVTSCYPIATERISATRTREIESEREVRAARQIVVQKDRA